MRDSIARRLQHCAQTRESTYCQSLSSKNIVIHGVCVEINRLLQVPLHFIFVIGLTVQIAIAQFNCSHLHDRIGWGGGAGALNTLSSSHSAA